jgi:uncharacterized protein
MGALLRLAVLGGIIWFLYRTLLRATTEAAVKAVAENPPPPGGATIQMHQCAWCGVHVAEGESTQSRGQFFCSEAHRDAWLAKS